MKFTHTVLTSRVMDAAEEMYKDITITADHRQQIEHAAYVACMNEDTAAARLADFRRVLKLHHVSPEDIAPTTPAEAAQAAPAAPQANPITAAMIASIGAPAPAQTVTVTWSNGSRATYSADLLDLLRTDPAALDIQDDTTGEMVYIKPDSTQAATEAPEQPTTDEKKEEENTMSNTTERYDYMEHMTADVIDAIRERYTDDEIRSRMDDDRDEFAQDLNDDLWTDDSVTGNASGSYYCNAWRAEDAIAHNWDLIADMIDEFDAADILRKGPEAIDVSIRCYLLGQAIDAALDQLDDEIPEAEEDDEDDDTDSISA